MKIYTKIVLDIDSWETLYEESYDYEGRVDECKSGGAGGGSPSGTVAYPAYMEAVHKRWLVGAGADVVSKSITVLMSEAMAGASPFSGFQTVNVDYIFAGPYQSPINYISPYARLQDFGCFDVESKYNQYISDDNALIEEAIDAESALLDDEIYSKVLPRFQSGMDDINAVQTSSFVLGEALIWDGRTKQVSKFSAQIRLNRLDSQAEIAIKRIGAYVEWARLVTSMSAELARIYTAAKHELDSLSVEIKAKDRLFDLGIYQFGVNVMSSIAGSAVSPPDPGMGKTGLGGPLSAALSGGAAGAMMAPGNPALGIGAGAAIGLAGYYLT